MTDAPRHLVVGTAGHIDHGKSTLVAALTGTDPDRLPEEQERGITIDLGFAHAEAPTEDGSGLVLSFVDVPGHERFVKNMLAGAGGVDLVLLVVAADESVMPQTREHFQICRLLGARHGVVALTKSDLVEEDLVSLVRLEVEDLVQGSFLEGAPILPVSSVTGEGVEEIRAALAEEGAEAPRRSLEGPFRLPVDRVFTIRGFGTVATGTAVSGVVAQGDNLEILPRGDRVKVRGIQVHGGEVSEAGAGRRVALNLQGVDLDEVERGDWLARPGRWEAASMADADIELLPEAPAPLVDMDRVRFHLGAREVLARVRILEPEGRIAPGGRGKIQIRMESPIHLVAGERFVLRRYSPITTVAGGAVLDPHPPKRSRHLPEEAELLEELATLDPLRMVSAWIRLSGRDGLSAREIEARTDWPGSRVSAVWEAVAAESGATPAADRLVAADVWEALVGEAVAALAAWHGERPLSPGMGRAELRAMLHLGDGLFDALLEDTSSRGLLRREGDRVALADHAISLSEEEAATRDAILASYRSAGLQPPDEEEVLAARAGARARELQQLLIEEGRLVRLKGGWLFHHEVLDELEETVRGGPETFTVPEFKERTGTTRKHAIPLLEYLDGRNVTLRTGDVRKVLPRREITSAGTTAGGSAERNRT